MPVGAYLSGGLEFVDHRRGGPQYTGNRLKTFSIAFTDEQFDERVHQQRMADHLGTEHISLECTRRGIARGIPRSGLARRDADAAHGSRADVSAGGLVQAHGLKVVLTGEGSDEFLGGYDIFKEARIRRFWAARPEVEGAAPAAAASSTATSRA